METPTLTPELKEKWGKYEKQMRDQFEGFLAEMKIKFLDLIQEKQKMDLDFKKMKESTRIKIDVGGKIFVTSLATLVSEKGSMLEAMFSGRFAAPQKTEDGAYFIDRNPMYFDTILEWLRSGDLTLTDGSDEYLFKLIKEAQYYGLDSLVKEIHNVVEDNQRIKAEAIESEGVLVGHAGVVACLVAKGNRVFSGSWDKTAKMWDIETRTCLATFAGHSDYVNCITANETHVFTGSGDKTIRMWSVTNHMCEKVFNGHTNYIRCLFLKDKVLYSGSEDQSIKMWNISTGLCEKTFVGHTNSIFCLQLLPNKQLMSGSYDYTAKLWDVESGKCLRTLNGHANYIYAATFNHTHLFTAGGDRDIFMWNCATWNIDRKFIGHTSSIYSLSVSDRYLFSGGHDETLKIWNLATGQCEKTLTSKIGAIYSMTITTHYLLTGGSDTVNGIRIWQIKKKIENDFLDTK